MAVCFVWRNSMLLGHYTPPFLNTLQVPCVFLFINFFGADPILYVRSKCCEFRSDSMIWIFPPQEFRVSLGTRSLCLFWLLVSDNGFEEDFIYPVCFDLSSTKFFREDNIFLWGLFKLMASYAIFSLSHFVALLYKNA